MTRKLLPLLALLALASCTGHSKKEVELTTPSAIQLEFMDNEIGAFFHFTTNTYTGDEHGDGTAPTSVFNPTKIDLDQWMQTAKDMGAKYAILTARHEDGFCLWPTKTTDYCISSSPWKDGKGDLVKDFVEACRRHGLKPGLYFSPYFNAHAVFSSMNEEVTWGKKWDSLVRVRLQDSTFLREFCQLDMDQITELMTNYGPIYQVWMDHWSDNMNCDSVTAIIRRLQPDCIMTGPDIRTPGNEKSTALYPSWNAVFTKDSTNSSRAVELVPATEGPNEYGLLETAKVSGHPYGKFWRNVETPTADLFNHGGWFWHGPMIPMSMEERIECYYRSVGLGATILINLPPDQDGLIPAETVAAAKAWGDTIRKLFYGPFVAETSQTQEGDEVELAWETPCRIDHVMLMENLADGQKVAKYTLEAFVDGQWQAVTLANQFKYCPKGYNDNPGFETIGHKKIDRIVPVVTNRMRFRCTESVAEPVEIAKFAVWNVGQDTPAAADSTAFASK